MDFPIQADNSVKRKENETIDKLLDLDRELKKLWDMNVKVIPIVYWNGFQRLGELEIRESKENTEL